MQPRPVTPLGILVQHLENAVKEEAPTKEHLEQALALAAGLEPYLEACSTPASAALSYLAQKTASEDWSKRFSDGETVRQLEQEMLSGHLEGQTLKMFVQMSQAQRLLEVGMFTGYSALAMAEALPPEGYLVACEVDPYVADLARSCFERSPHGKKIRIEVAPALFTLEKLAQAGEVFDLVFIDADKREYSSYLQILLDGGLVKPHGFIFVDNTLLQGQPYLSASQRTANGEAIAQFNDFVAQDERVEQVLLPIRDGLTMIRRK